MVILFKRKNFTSRLQRCLLSIHDRRNHRQVSLSLWQDTKFTYVHNTCDYVCTSRLHPSFAATREVKSWSDHEHSDLQKDVNRSRCHVVRYHTIPLISFRARQPISKVRYEYAERQRDTVNTSLYLVGVHTYLCSYIEKSRTSKNLLDTRLIRV